MGLMPLFIEIEPEIEFVGDDLIKVTVLDDVRIMPRSLHYAFCKKAVAAHERFLAERARRKPIPLRKPPRHS